MFLTKVHPFKFIQIIDLIIFSNRKTRAEESKGKFDIKLSEEDSPAEF
ncbi:MAG: hypothetical protein CM1200mP28_03650 [Deltaproteobacteria bacterium]|nr:MAG: hypothetical protein CM1200mP28_03650 [Deltaproteobacteria bacterium]